MTIRELKANPTYLCDQIKDTEPSFHNARKLYQKIDSLPTGPEWIHEVLSVETGLKNADGSLKLEEVQLFRRDPNECIEELIGDPTFNGHIVFSPEKVFVDSEKTKRCFGEMNTGDWWDEVQVRVFASCRPLQVLDRRVILIVCSGQASRWCNRSTRHHIVRRNSAIQVSRRQNCLAGVSLDRQHFKRCSS